MTSGTHFISHLSNSSSINRHYILTLVKMPLHSKTLQDFVVLEAVQLLKNINWMAPVHVNVQHPAGTSEDTDKCDTIKSL